MAGKSGYLLFAAIIVVNLLMIAAWVILALDAAPCSH